MRLSQYTDYNYDIQTNNYHNSTLFIWAGAPEKGGDRNYYKQ